ncbi:TonB family C- domain protein [Treponema primitia ZAS-2]|uniref:TonB family C-domain protein n=1 Tax=Treponema primitia (strain ATCC BAA-887 / DSM 12427 / ZAS-2) TaxID=545694 RepID=F5YH74_TREPZ|nr:energy transducer TonB [Treponema primitia]AEF84922.1 TonB family C- domain protein [Treponema primitia ZAS-2]
MKKNLWPLIICVSMVIHGLIFFILSAFPMPVSPALKQKPSGEAFSLVNLALAEPPEAPRDDPRPRTAPEIPMDPQTEIPPAPTEEADAELSSQSLAENFITLEDSPEDKPGSAAPASAGSPAGMSPVEAGDGSSAGSSSGNSPQTAAYLSRNYNYIQRRIRDSLVYPAQARRTGIQGTAELIFTIHEDGRVSGVRVSESSGSALLDAAAVEAIYAAAPFRRPPAEARLLIPVAFRLH